MSIFILTFRKGKDGEKEDRKEEKQIKNPGLLGRGSQPAQALGQKEEDSGRMKFKNSKVVNNSLLAAVTKTAEQQAAEQVTVTPTPKAPMEADEGTGVIKLKGKLKVDYKETEAERVQREAQQEIRKKEDEKRAQLEAQNPKRDHASTQGYKQHDTKQHDSKQHDFKQHDSKQHEYKQHDSKHHDTKQHDSKQHDLKHHETKHVEGKTFASLIPEVPKKDDSEKPKLIGRGGFTAVPGKKKEGQVCSHLTKGQ